MAEHLASIFGTEKDRVNCPFYFKIGACRHGDRCSRLHTKPSISPTLLLSNMYQRPDMITPGVDPQGQPLDPKKIQSHFEDFYEDLFQELSKYGDIQSLNICDNLADHMVGNVYIQFREEDQAQNALQNLIGRSYEGRPIIADFSPVTDFREATCRQYEENKRRSPPTMIEVEGQEAEVLVAGMEEAEAPGEGETGVPVRESSAERRAKIEQWNKEREAESAIDNSNRSDDVSHVHQQKDGPTNDDNQHPAQQENGNYDF
ncbi:UNVERIFIED_CONTAM: Splicing factor U2af small subunit B [Sesamum radiatum]|uniref:Splicing factor U2af small subunit B n=1 Tax=Sesamum radiatum TaxID=300843 RepID=A0AAW2LAJ6_SESRA